MEGRKRKKEYGKRKRKEEMQKEFVPTQIRTEIKGTKIPYTNLYTIGT